MMGDKYHDLTFKTRARFDGFSAVIERETSGLMEMQCKICGM